MPFPPLSAWDTPGTKKKKPPHWTLKVVIKCFAQCPYCGWPCLLWAPGFRRGWAEPHPTRIHPHASCFPTGNRERITFQGLPLFQRKWEESSDSRQRGRNSQLSPTKAQNSKQPCSPLRPRWPPNPEETSGGSDHLDENPSPQVQSLSCTVSLPLAPPPHPAL